ncbi:MAG: amino acid permease [Gammaproteobacteria bacterium]|nr:amino acid permease [Gammaproteobacteria bacterium]
MSNQSFQPKKIMGVFSLVMINVIAVDSLRSLPATAQYGFSVVFYYLFAGLLFFIPTALIAGELATGWPETGGIYVWAKTAFNTRIAFLLVCLQWTYNVCWYPTILSLMAATLAYCINPALSHNHTYMFASIMIMFWGIALINCLGMKCSNYLTSFSSLVGTLIPIGLVIVLGGIWLLSGHHSEISFSLHSFIPTFSNFHCLAFFTLVLFSLMGMEMSAIHAKEVKNPQRDYPKALLISGTLILGSFIFASLAIAVVVPSHQLNVVTGLLEAYQLFFTSFHMRWMMPILALLMVCGGAGGVGAWLLGPVKALLVASQDGLLPPALSVVNRFNAPYRLIILQGLVFMALSTAFLFMPSVSAGFWLLSDLAAQLSLLFYIGLFVVAIRLRYAHPEVKRAFNIPFGKAGMWALCISGITCCAFTIGAGFLPPAGIEMGSLIRFELFLIGGIIVSCCLPLLIARGK